MIDVGWGKEVKMRVPNPAVAIRDPKSREPEEDLVVRSFMKLEVVVTGADLRLPKPQAPSVRSSYGVKN